LSLFHFQSAQSPLTSSPHGIILAPHLIGFNEFDIINMNRASANGGISRHNTATANSACEFFSGPEEIADHLTGRFERVSSLERATSWNSHA
jgi:hypothetical protein